MRVCYVSGTVLCTLHKLFHLNSTVRLVFLWFLVFFYTSKPRFWDFTYAIPVSGSDMIQIWACRPYSSCAIHSTITDFQLQINLYQKNYEDCMEVQKKYARIKLKENCSSKKKIYLHNLQFIIILIAIVTILWGTMHKLNRYAFIFFLHVQR